MAKSSDTHLMIRDMLSQERPREKALRLGIKALSDVELMAILFSTGIKGKSVIDLSREILNDNSEHLSKVARLSVKDFLMRYKGIGQAKALTLLAALELGSRSAADAKSIDNPSVTSSAIAYELMRPHFERLEHEEFWVMFLSQSAKVISTFKVGQGGMTATTVDMKLILREALIVKAISIILFHNHPSGNLRPSIQDKKITSDIVAGAKLLQINVNDHIIFADNGYYSFADAGEMP